MQNEINQSGSLHVIEPDINVSSSTLNSIVTYELTNSASSSLLPSQSQYISPEDLKKIEDLKLYGKLDQTVVGNERIAAILLRKMDVLEKEILDLKTKKILDETQMPYELLEKNGLLPTTSSFTKAGSGYRQILQSDIIEAQKHSPWANGQARWLGVSYPTFKKWAKRYGLFKPNPNAKGRMNVFDPNRGKFPLNEILKGLHPHVNPWVVKDKLLRSGFKKTRCEICGYNKRRITDNRMCLILNYLDGDIKNHKIENLQLLCYNCTFECGRGFVKRGTAHKFDPDWIQGNPVNNLKAYPRW